jgi:hypothetical protein
MATTSSEFDYPEDATGVNPVNKITGEIGVVTPVNYRDYNLVIPRYAPFYAESLTITFRDTSGVIVPLTEGVDYYLGYWYIGASRGVAKPVYGSIQFLNTELSGTLTLGYQTLGGRWTLSEADIAEILSDRLENPRITSWEQVTGVPLVFPVIDHVWDLIDQVGLKDVTAKLGDIADQLRQQGSGGLADHIADKSNPHNVTKAQVGLGNVQNNPMATQAAAEAGLSNDYMMSPLSTMQAMLKNIITPFNTHAAARNPHGTTAADVGTYSQAQLDNLLGQKLSADAVAYDSVRLQGMTYATLRDAILQGTAQNSVNFNGYSFDDYAAYVLQGTAANSQKFNGQTMTEFLASLDSRFGGAANAGVSKNYSFSGGGDGSGNIWHLLGTARLADPSLSYVPVTDLVWIVSGLCDADNANSASYYVRIALRAAHDAANAATFAVATSLDPVAARDQIGWVVSADGKTVSVYVKTRNAANYITVNEINKGVSALADDNVTAQTVEPAGITYINPMSFVTSTQFVQMMTSMQTAFDNLTTALTT